MALKICHYFEWESWITGGQAQSVRNQRTMMELEDIQYITTPTLDVDILHLNNMGPRSLFYARRARAADVPVIIHTHQTAADFRNSFMLSNLIAPGLRPYLRYAYSLADQLICPSAYTRRQITRSVDGEATVLSNGFDPDKLDGFESLRTEYQDRYGLDSPVVFMIGHVLERKGLETFIETAKSMPSTDFAWFGYINPFGGGLAGRLLTSRRTRELIRTAPPNCTFTGYIDDIRGGYAAGDIFFFPTRNENEGIALLEAMACGRPAVLRDIETFDWLENGVDCLKATESFVEPIEQLHNESQRRKFGAQAKRRSQEFELTTLAPQLNDIYHSVL